MSGVLADLLKGSTIGRKPELSVADGLEEVGEVERLLVALSDVEQESAGQQKAAGTSSVNCVSYWNPTCGTFTYHTHAVVESFGPGSVDRVASLFFNAYSLEKHDWYSQFVGGENRPLPEGLVARAGEPSREYQVGQGYFDFGVPKLRRYHILTSLRQTNPDTAAVVLRSIDHPFDQVRESKKVFLLAPTGDYFSLVNGNLHWHHICTVAGISLLPGRADRYLMNALRYLRMDVKERNTYNEEAQAFIRFASRQ